MEKEESKMLQHPSNPAGLIALMTGKVDSDVQAAAGAVADWRLETFMDGLAENQRVAFYFAIIKRKGWGFIGRALGLSDAEAVKWRDSDWFMYGRKKWIVWRRERVLEEAMINLELEKKSDVIQMLLTQEGLGSKTASEAGPITDTERIGLLKRGLDELSRLQGKGGKAESDESPAGNPAPDGKVDGNADGVSENEAPGPVG